jgi:FkbM family methyltransferase
MKNNVFLVLLIISISAVAKEEYLRLAGPPYYSQCGQDKFVNERFFKNKKNGVFIDIGAHDGVSYSNTYFFEKDLDWTGICIEPHPQRFKDLLSIRSNKTICLPIAVADFDGSSKFLQVTGYPEMLSGLLDYYDPRHLDRVDKEISNRGGDKITIDVQVLKLKNILEKYKIVHVDFMSIDTEGSELEVLKSIDFSKVVIDVIMIENNFGENKISQYLISRNYKLIRRIGGDEVYVYANTY